MWTVLWLLATLVVPALGTYESIDCPLGLQCQRALLSHNDIVLRCNLSQEAQWFHYSLHHGSPGSNITTFPNMEQLPEGHLLIRSPEPSQSGFYLCTDRSSGFTATYEIDFQDAGTLHVTHMNLSLAPLREEVLSLGSGTLVFTRWEPWQDCSRCGRVGERRRLGFCFIREAEQQAAPCGLYLGTASGLWSRRLRPEMQVDACYTPCRPGAQAPLVVFSSFKFDETTESVWLTCPLGSIYR